nr:hypothetical protein CFP56_08837 [Quercus suber]
MGTTVLKKLMQIWPLTGLTATQGRNSRLNLEVNTVMNKGSNSVSNLGSNSMITQPSKCVINQDLLPKLVSVQQTVESDKHLKGIEVKLSKFDFQNSPAINKLGPESRAVKMSPTQTQVNEARASQVTARVSSPSSQLRVLPSWTRRVRNETHTANLGSETISGQKYWFSIRASS